MKFKIYSINVLGDSLKISLEKNSNLLNYVINIFEELVPSIKLEDYKKSDSKYKYREGSRFSFWFEILISKKRVSVTIKNNTKIVRSFIKEIIKVCDFVKSDSK